MRSAVLTLACITLMTSPAHTKDSLAELTYDQTAAIYNQAFDRIERVQKLGKPLALETRMKALAWIHTGPCQQKLAGNDQRLFAAARGSVQAARVDSPRGAAILQMIAIFMRENDGRHMSDFACRFARESLKQP